MKALTDAAVRQYHASGYFAPVAALSSAEATMPQGKLAAFEADAGVLAGKPRYEQRPDSDVSKVAQAYHASVTDAHARILMRETGRAMRA